MALISGIAAGRDQNVGLLRMGAQRYRAFLGDTLVYGELTPGIAKIKTDAPETIVVSEGFRTSFLVWLDREPLRNVNIRVQIADHIRSPIRLVTATRIRFTPHTYNIPIIVTIEANDIPDVTDLYTSLTLSGPANRVSNSVTRQVHVRNDDLLLPRLELSERNLELGIGGDTDSFTARLTLPPSGTVSVSMSALVNATTNPNTLTFGPADWNVPRTVEVTTHGQGTGVETLTLSPSGGGVNESAEEVTVKIVDKAQVFVSPDSLTLLEGETKELRVRVINAPENYVVIVRVDENSPYIYAGPQLLTFTDARDQTVRVSALRNVLQGGEDATAQVRFILSGGGDNYVKLLPVQVVNTSATPLLTVSPAYLPMDGGTQATVAVRLTQRPYGDATVEVSLPTALGTVSPARLTFTRDNWNVAQQVLVRAITLAAGAENVVGELSFVGSGGGLADVAAVSVLVASTGAGQNRLILGSSAVSVAASASVQVGVQLDRPPITGFTLGQPTDGIVNVALASGDASKVSVSPASMTFDTDDWDTPKAITLTAAAGTAGEDITITLTPSGGNSDGVAREVVANVIAEAAGELPILRYKTRRPVMVPGGPYVRGQYTLTHEPAAPVEITATVATAEELRERGYTFSTNPIVLEDAPVTLRFDKDNYDDGLVLATRALASAKQRGGILRYRVTQGELGSNYQGRLGLPTGFIPVDIAAEGLNDIFPVWLASNIILADGESMAVGVQLRQRPTHPITVRVVEQSARLSVSGATLNFTPPNWNVPQYVTLVARSNTSQVARTFNIYAYASGQDASSDPAVLEVEVTPAATVDAPLNLAVTFGNVSYAPDDPAQRHPFRETWLSWEGPPEVGTTVGFVVTFTTANGVSLGFGGIDPIGNLRLYYRTSAMEILNAGIEWTATVTRYKGLSRQASETLTFTPQA